MSLVYEGRVYKLKYTGKRRKCWGESKHILVIATGSNIRLLAAMRTWGMDGTFKVVPQWYQQLLTTRRVDPFRSQDVAQRHQP
ncbi:hypothetical protein T05_4584 [Trichinella murrelli]|uniref:Uncharacterized protein n=1 Tax=Trichinella murrelli TaxID=144512 RepID=A0A0V0TPM7_9BILA|nr:hypothetical protein T05_4584 [Trichinella murrelli]